jgi:hypothetical protein
MPDEPGGFSLSRRMLLGAASLAAIGGAAAFAPDGEPDADERHSIQQRVLSFREPRERLESLMRVERTLGEHEVAWWFWVAWFLVVPGRSPVPLVRYETMEMSRHRRLPGDRYIVHGHNLGFARDFTTGRYTRELRHPVTGESVAVADAAILDHPGYEFSPLGVRALNEAHLQPADELWRIEDALLHLQRTRGAPRGWPGSFLEQHTTSVALNHYRDLTKSQLPARSCGSCLQPAPRWLGDAEAIVLAQFHGRKLDGLQQLPRDYFDRLERDYPQFLKVNESKFRDGPAGETPA